MPPPAPIKPQMKPMRTPQTMDWMARFFAADATRWIGEAAAAAERADVIFMDPPQEGSTRACGPTTRRL